MVKISLMSQVVFLRAINVGGANLCKPAQLAKQLRQFDVVNIGAVGTFVVRGKVSQSVFRQELAAQLAKTFAIKCEIMIAPARDLINLASRHPFRNQPFGPEFTRFMSVLHKSPKNPPQIPILLPDADNWLLKITAIEGQFVLGVYRREMKAIGYLGKLEKILGVPATTRSWSTIEKVIKILS